MQSYKLLSLSGLLLLGACAPTLPVQVEPEGYTSRPASERIQDLESAAAQLREQQLAMGQSLTWIEGQIKAMRHQESLEGSPLAAPVTAPPAQPHHPTPAPAATPPDTPTEKHSEASPTPLVPAAEPATVSALSNEDMDVEPDHPHNEGSAATASSGFAVHLASYARPGQLMRGWQEIKQHNGTSLEGLEPFGSRFTDARGRHWVRLNVGPFETRRAAADRCSAIKATGTFCDVQEVSADSIIAVN